MSKRPGKSPLTTSGDRNRLKKVRKTKKDVAVQGKEDSGPRHLKSRGISASARRKSQPSTVPLRVSTNLEHTGDRPFDSEDEGDVIGDVTVDDVDVSDEYDVESEEMESVKEFLVRKGANGKFVGPPEGSSTSSRKQPKKVDDESWRVTSPMGGGPIDGSVIPSFGAHVARFIWEGMERDFLTCYQRMSACEQLRDWAAEFLSPIPDGQREGTDKRNEDEIELGRLVSLSGLHTIPSIMYPHLDVPLLCAFVERWQPDTNSFHLPFGEMTIMLHDVQFILSLPIDGQLVTDGHPELITDLCGILGVTEEELVSKKIYQGGGVDCKSIFTTCRLAEDLGPDTRAIAYLLLTLGSTLFVDKSGSRLRGGNLTQLLEPEKVSGYSWGSACLAFLYRQLGEASRRGCRGFGGCLTLLQAWIYEYFACFRPHRERLAITEGDPRARLWEPRCEPRSPHRLQSIRQRIDQLTPAEITWLPYGCEPWKKAPRTLLSGFITHHSIVEPYSPARCLRQLGFIQTIPPPMPPSARVIRVEDPRLYHVEYAPSVVEMCWSMYPHAFTLIPSSYKVATVPYESTDDYMSWFQKYSHPYVVPPKDVLDHQGPDATMPDYWMQEFSTRASFVFNPLVDELPDNFAVIKDGLLDMRQLVRHFDKALGFVRPSPSPPPK